MMTLAFINNLMGMDSLVILLIALLIFGKRLPEIMRGLGSSVGEFKRGLNDQSFVQPVAQSPAPAQVAQAPVAPQVVAETQSVPLGVSKQMP